MRGVAVLSKVGDTVFQVEDGEIYEMERRLGELSGCGESTIANMAVGRRVKPETLNKLAKALGVPPQELMED